MSETVPCRGCTLCCQQGGPFLMPDEDASRYEIDREHSIGPLHKVRNAVDGGCYYRCADGCMIWERRPRMCRAFDCRQLTLEQSNPQAVRIYERGQQLLREQAKT